MNKLTAAHRKWAFDTIVRVKNLSNDREVDVRITDRGPFVRGRIIDLSRAAAQQIDLIGPGVTKVKLKVVRRSAVNPVAAPATASTASPTATSSPVASSGEAKPAQGDAMYGVQAGAFSDQSRAQALRDQLSTSFAPASVVRRDGQTTLWRVVVGEVETREQAEDLAARVRMVIPDAMVVRLHE